MPVRIGSGGGLTFGSRADSLSEESAQAPEKRRREVESRQISSAAQQAAIQELTSPQPPMRKATSALRELDLSRDLPISPRLLRPDLSRTPQIVAETPERAKDKVAPPHMNWAEKEIEEIRLGFRDSGTGMYLTDKMPEEGNIRNETTVNRLTRTAAGLIADAPQMAVGGAIGSFVAGPIGAGGGAFASMEAFRLSQLQRLQNELLDRPLTLEEEMDQARDVMTASAKGFVVGGVTAGIAPVAGGLARGAVGKGVTAVAGKTAGRVAGGIAETGAGMVASSAALSGVGAAVEGEEPTWEGFKEALMLVAAFHGGKYVGDKAPAALRSTSAALFDEFRKRGQAFPIAAQNAIARETVWDAYDRGTLDRRTAEVADRLIQRDEQFDMNSTIQVADVVRRATAAELAEAGVPEGTAGTVRGMTEVRPIEDGNLETAITLYKGADSNTVVHEWAHRYWEQLSPEEQAAYTADRVARGGDPARVKEDFANEGADYILGKGLADRGAGTVALFNRAQRGLLRLVGLAKETAPDKVSDSTAKMFEDAALKGLPGTKPVEMREGQSFQVAPDTPEFKSFFEGSKAVDGRGKPLPVYHGTPDGRWVKSTGIFQTLKERGGMEDADAAFFFVKDRGVAGTYANDTRAWDYQNAEPQVVSAYLSIKNPLIIDMAGADWYGTRGAVKKAKEAGHDGIIIKNVKDRYSDNTKGKPSDVYVVFSSNQIKSTANRGTYDPNDPRISYQIEPDPPPVVSFDSRLAEVRDRVLSGELDPVEASKYIGNINYKRIGSDADGIALINEINRAFGTELDEARGPVAKQEATKAAAEKAAESLAAELSLGPKAFEQMKANLRAQHVQATAIRVLFEKVNFDIVKMTEEINRGGGSPEKQVDYLQLLHFHQTMQELATVGASSAGRTLNSFNIQAKSDLFRNVELREILRAHGGPEAGIRLAQEIGAVIDAQGAVEGRLGPTDISKALEGVPGFKDLADATKADPTTARATADAIKAAADLLETIPPDIVKGIMRRGLTPERIKALQDALQDTANNPIFDGVDLVKMLNKKGARSVEDMIKALDEMGGILADPIFQGVDIPGLLKRNPSQIRKMAKALENLKTTGRKNGAIAAMARKVTVPGWWDALTEIRICGMLYNPTTHAANTIGNLIIAASQPVELALAAAIGKGRKAAGRKLGMDTDSFDVYSYQESLGYTYGLFDGLGSAFKMFGKAMLTGEQDAALRGKAELPRKVITGKFFQQKFPNMLSPEHTWTTPFMMGFADVAGEVVRGSGRALSAADEFFYTLNHRASLAQQAFLDATSEGLELGSKDFGRRVRELIDNPTDAATQAARDHGRYATLTNELESVTMQRVQALQATPLGRQIVPFLRTPVNIFKYANRRLPTAMLDIGVLRDIKSGGRQADMALARIGLGSTLMGFAMIMAGSGMITGSGPVNKGQRATWLQDGYQPYSIMVDGKWNSFNRFDPWGMILGVGADVYTVQVQSKDVDLDELALGVVSAIARNMTSKTWLMSLAETIDVLEDPQHRLERYLGRQASSFVPFSGTLRFYQNISEDTIRRTTGMLDPIRAMIPGMADDLPPRRNVWGDIMKKEYYPAKMNAWLLPIQYKKAGGDPVTDEMLRLGMGITVPDENLKIGTQVVELEPEEYDRYLVLIGKEATTQAYKGRFSGMTLYDALKTEIDSYDYSLLRDSAQSDKGGRIHGIMRAIRGDWDERRGEFDAGSAKDLLVKETPRLQMIADEERWNAR